jgi:hypothetical protein
MEWDEIRKQRLEAIDNMNRSLLEIEYIGIPLPVAYVLMFPIFIMLMIGEIGNMFWLLLKLWVTFLYRIITAPFLVLRLFADIVVLAWWFLCLVCKKMSGR